MEERVDTETWEVSGPGFFRTLMNFTGRTHLLGTATCAFEVPALKSALSRQIRHSPQRPSH
jgi:hypothetical protein